MNRQQQQHPEEPNIAQVNQLYPQQQSAQNSEQKKESSQPVS